MSHLFSLFSAQILGSQKGGNQLGLLLLKITTSLYFYLFSFLAETVLKALTLSPPSVYLVLYFSLLTLSVADSDYHTCAFTM